MALSRLQVTFWGGWVCFAMELTLERARNRTRRTRLGKSGGGRTGVQLTSGKALSWHSYTIPHSCFWAIRCPIHPSKLLGRHRRRCCCPEGSAPKQDRVPSSLAVEVRTTNLTYQKSIQHFGNSVSFWQAVSV